MRYVVALGLVAFAGVAARGEDPVSFTKEVQPFLKKYCQECHNSKEAKSGLNVESYDALLNSVKKGKKHLLAGDPDASRLLLTMEGKGKQMPPKKSTTQPTKPEVAKIRAWIKEGAKNDAAKTELPLNEDRRRLLATLLLAV